MKKILTAFIFLALVGTVFVGCAGKTTSKANVQQTTISGTSQPLVSTSGENSNMSPDALQTAVRLNVTEPVDASTINGDTVTVKGHTEPDANVNVNGDSTTADSNGDFTITVSLDEGLNAIDVIATGAQNREGEVLLMVYAVIPSNTMTTSPESNSPSGTTTQETIPLKVTSPADAADLDSSTVAVTGQTSPGAIVTANGETDIADTGGNFSITISLNQGPNIIDVTASDDSGNSNEVTLMVNVASG